MLLIGAVCHTIYQWNLQKKQDGEQQHLLINSIHTPPSHNRRACVCFWVTFFLFFGTITTVVGLLNPDSFLQIVLWIGIVMISIGGFCLPIRECGQYRKSNQNTGKWEEPCVIWWVFWIFYFMFFTDSFVFWINLSITLMVIVIGVLLSLGALILLIHEVIKGSRRTESHTFWYFWITFFSIGSLIKVFTRLGAVVYLSMGMQILGGLVLMIYEWKQWRESPSRINRALFWLFYFIYFGHYPAISLFNFSDLTYLCSWLRHSQDVDEVHEIMLIVGVFVLIGTEIFLYVRGFTSRITHSHTLTV
jgi:hypothetical protein